MQSRSADFVRSFFLTSAVLIVWNVLLNLAVDPYGVYGGYPASLFHDIQFDADSRVDKAELARRFSGSTALVGSSRVEVGYNPESPAIPDGPACNLGLTGTTFHEVSRVVDFVLKQPRLRRIVLCLDFEQFTKDQDVNHDFELSRFNSDLSTFEYHCNLLLRRDVTRVSIKTLGLYASGERGDYTSLGFRRPEAMETNKGVARLARKKIIDALSDAETRDGYRTDFRQLETLERLVRKCVATDRELIVLIQPVHATMLESLHCAGQWDDFERWLADVVRVVDGASRSQVPVWDFTGFSPYTIRPLVTSQSTNPRDNRWFWEPSHCKLELGEQVLRRIFNRPGADSGFGNLLAPDDLPDHLARIRGERDAWARANPEEAKRVAQLAREAGHNVHVQVAGAVSDTSKR